MIRLTSCASPAARGQSWKSLALAASCVAAALTGNLPHVASATDADIVNAFGFEVGTPPNGFTTTFLGTGQLEGQVNPPGFGQVISPGQWLRTKGTGLSTAVVQDVVYAPGGGDQAVRVDKAADSDDRWAVPVNHLGYPDYPSPFPPEPPQPIICIMWDMMVLDAGGDPNALDFGPLFGVETYDDDAQPVALLASMFVSSTTGDVLYQAPGTGFLTDTGSTVAFGTWNTFSIELDYSTHDYTLFLNGASLGSFDFVDDANFPGTLNEFSDADIATVASFGNPASLARTGTAYFDNFVVKEGPCIPEPHSLALGAIGCLAIGGLRRRPLGLL